MEGSILVGGLEPWNFMFPIILGVIIPTDELHHFSEELKPPTSIYVDQKGIVAFEGLGANVPNLSMMSTKFT